MSANDMGATHTGSLIHVKIGVLQSITSHSKILY